MATTKDPNSQEFELVIVSPDQVLFEGIVYRVIAPGIKQEIAILPDHTPLYAQLVKGTITVSTSDGKTLNFDVESGIIRMRANSASIITGFDARGEVFAHSATY